MDISDRKLFEAAKRRAGPEAEYIAEEKKRRGIEIWKESQIPSRFTRKKLEDLIKHEEWHANQKLLCDVVGQWEIAILCGKRGTGKTQAAVEVARHLCQECKVVGYVRAIEVGMQIRATYKSDIANELQALKHLAGPHLLIMDECQEVKSDSDFESRMLTTLIDMRYGEERPTILVCNQQPDKLDEIFSQSVLSRVNEGGGVLEYNWNSFREAKI